MKVNLILKTPQRMNVIRMLAGKFTETGLSTVYMGLLYSAVGNEMFTSVN